MRKALRKQLNYVKRNLKTIDELWGGDSEGLSEKSLRKVLIIRELYRRQQEMCANRNHRIADRIVSISQPYVRPIVRGNAGRDVEFGVKLSVSLTKGFVYLDRIGWDAYNEGGDMIGQVESYRERFGYYPEAVLGDQIYGTRENRKYLKAKGIRYSGKALGRPRKLSKEEKRLLSEEGKQKYDLNLVKAKTKETSESWIAAVFFVMK